VLTRAAGGFGRGRRHAGHLNVFRWAEASWYGPGLYGGHLACGGTLEPGTLGVANKVLPCGTPVTLRHHGHTIRVAVVDRGPYVAGREFDLTAATAQRIGFSGHGPVQVSTSS
jgi:rare lipoprotein A